MNINENQWKSMEIIENHLRGVGGSGEACKLMNKRMFVSSHIHGTGPKRACKEFGNTEDTRGARRAAATATTAVPGDGGARDGPAKPDRTTEGAPWVQALVHQRPLDAGALLVEHVRLLLKSADPNGLPRRVGFYGEGPISPEHPR